MTGVRLDTIETPDVDPRKAARDWLTRVEALQSEMARAAIYVRYDEHRCGDYIRDRIASTLDFLYGASVELTAAAGAFDAPPEEGGAS